jgi:hypothetical protein
MRGPGRDVDHLARAARQHVRADGAGAERRLGQIDVHDEFKFVVGNANGAVLLARQCHQRLADRISQRIYEDGDTPKGREDPINDTPDLVRLGNVGDDGNDAAPGCRRDLRRRAFDVFRRQALSAMSAPATAST